jgi:hypothetical protein
VHPLALLPYKLTAVRSQKTKRFLTFAVHGASSHLAWCELTDWFVQAGKQKLMSLSLQLELESQALYEECPAPEIEVVGGREDLTQLTVSKVP